MSMVNWEFIYTLTKRLCELGKNNREIPPLYDVEPFKHFFSEEGKLKYDELDVYDGKFTKRNINEISSCGRRIRLGSRHDWSANVT